MEVRTMVIWGLVVLAVVLSVTAYLAFPAYGIMTKEQAERNYERTLQEFLMEAASSNGFVSNATYEKLDAAASTYRMYLTYDELNALAEEQEWLAQQLADRGW